MKNISYIVLLISALVLLFYPQWLFKFRISAEEFIYEHNLELGLTMIVIVMLLLILKIVNKN